METNNLTYNEIYREKIIPIITQEDKDTCSRILTLSNSLYKGDGNKHIHSIIEYSDFLIFYSNQDSIVAFALVKSMSKKKGKVLNILLACVVPKNNFSKLLADSLYNFAVKYKYPFLYVSPRTPELRETFINYEFESIYGREGIDEVLEKEIDTLLE